MPLSVGLIGMQTEDGHWDGDGLMLCETFLKQASQVLLDKGPQLKLALICFLARGHLLIEDIPGVGKTTFAKTLSHLFSLQSNRVQFTNDLLPSDILGGSIYRPSTQTFELIPGPIFSQFLLADELNRATPKTQSALLQCMEERQITLDGKTHPLPEPFFLVATQNPRFQTGTYPLPESQLDRFLMRIELGYPNPESETLLILGASERPRPEDLTPIATPPKWNEVFKKVQRIHLSREIGVSIQTLLTRSRSAISTAEQTLGLSPRAGLALASAAKAAAYLSGRDFVLPDDLLEIASAVLNHRLSATNSSFRQGSTLAAQLVNAIDLA